MTHESTTQSPLAGPQAVEDGIRRAHRLRAQSLRVFLGDLTKAIVEPVVRWNQRHAVRRHLQELPDYILKDIGIGRHQIPSLVSGTLRRDPLALSPIGSQSARGHRNAAAPRAANSIFERKVPAAVNSNSKQEKSTAA